MQYSHPLLEGKRTDLNRITIHRTMVILTGNYPFGRIAEIPGISTNNFCSSSGSEDEEETAFHLMRNYPKSAAIASIILDSLWLFPLENV